MIFPLERQRSPQPSSGVFNSGKPKRKLRTVHKLRLIVRQHRHADAFYIPAQRACESVLFPRSRVCPADRCDPRPAGAVAGATFGGTP
jgi:hypothetical protein